MGAHWFVAASAVVIAGLGLGACSDDVHTVGVDVPTISITTTTNLALAGQDTAPAGPSSALDVVARKVSGATNGEVVLGADFNLKFLALQLRALGLDDTAATCVATKVQAKSGAAFAGLKVSELGQSFQSDPSTLLSCVSTAQVAGLAKLTPDPSRLPANELRPLLGEMLSAGLQTAGLSAEESACVGDRVIGAIPDSQLGTALGGTASAEQLRAALSSCLTTERLDRLAR